LTVIGATQSIKDPAMKLMNMVARLLRHDRGVTAIEYALIASLIGIAAFVGIGTIGTTLSGIFTTVASDF
jgi:pilus assembly protein Flp/PilA